MRTFLLLLLTATMGCDSDTFTAGDGATTDAATDALASDASGDGDATACDDTPVACLTNQVCDAFDNASAPYSPFTVKAVGGGTVATTNMSVSCPSSLVVTLPAIAAGSGARAVISGGAPVTGNHVLLALDVLLPAQTSTSAFFALTPDTSASTVVLAVDPTNNWVLTIDGVGTVLTPQPVVGAWTHMTLEVTYATVGKATLVYGGQTKVVSGNTNAGGTTVGAVGVEIGIDPGANATTRMMTAYYDNVVYSPF